MTFKSAILILIIAMAMTACGSPQNSKDTPSVTENSYFLTADQIITIDGVDIRYRDEGAKDAPTLVMIHGFTSSLETWDALADELRSDYRIIRLDLPGHGLSGLDPASDYSNARTVELFSQFVNKLDLEAPTIIGNSLGGLVAWRTAANYPKAISKLVLVSPGGFSINGVTDTPVDVPMLVKLYLRKAPEAGVKQASAALYGDPTKLTEVRLIQIRDMMKRPGNSDVFVLRAGQFTLPSPEEDLAKVDTPTLIIWGDKDIIVPPEHGSKFTSSMPNASLKSYGGVGHVPQEEVPAKLAADIRSFLKDKATP